MIKTLIVARLILMCAAAGVSAQQHFRITSEGAGGIRLGMTLNQARRALPGCRFERGSDGDGAALVDVACGGKHVISLYAGERDASSKVDWTSRIEFIEVWDRRFATPDGVRVGLTPRQATKILGRVKEIMLSEIESRQYVTFARARKGITYRTYGGIYPPDKNRTMKYDPKSTIFSIQIARPF